MADSIRELLALARAQLAASPTPDLDAEVLLQLCTDKDRAWLLANDRKTLEPAVQSRFWELVRRRRRGEPVAYLTGNREFWSLCLAVNNSVLVPRPETELLVERALVLIAADAKLRILDLGTGSGAIALAIAKERPRCSITAADCDASALELARANASALGVGNIQFKRSDWYQAINERFDLIVSNPPYVADGDPHLQQDELRFEPPHALQAGPDGLRDLKQIIAGAQQHLGPSGWCLLEHGPEQATSVATMLHEHGFKHVKNYQDLAGLPRMTEGQRAK